MNTLLGEIATLNDVNYARYRIAFKFRKLQKSFLLDYVDVAALQGVLQQTGVQRLPSDAPVPASLLSAVLGELYLTLRSIKPVVNASRLQLAQDQCLSWLQMAFNYPAGCKISAASLKLTLCLFIGAKPVDKARFIFTVLADTNGAVGSEGITLFCQVTDQLGQCLQEQLYRQWESFEQVFRECLQFVRSAEDVEEEELDGGIRRQWLSQFEVTRIFTAIPEPQFLGWMALWQRLPKMEKVVHPVRCGCCTRKPIVSFRYQCTQCPNFHLCQMCFLKGRTSDKHSSSHQMLEFSTPAKGQRSWHHRLLHISSKPKDGRLWAEPRQPFVYSARQSKENSVDGAVDTPLTALTDMINSSQNSRDLKPRPQLPVAEIRIGGGESLSKANGKKKRREMQHPPPSHPHPSPPSQRHNPSTLPHTSTGNNKTNNGSLPANRPISLSSGSPDSAQSSKFNYEGPLSSASSEHNPSPSSPSNSTSVQSPSRVVAMKPSVTVRPRPPEDQKPPISNLELSTINKRLSMEVDQLLSELPPPAAIQPFPRGPTPPSSSSSSSISSSPVGSKIKPLSATTTSSSSRGGAGADSQFRSNPAYKNTSNGVSLIRTTDPLAKATGFHKKQEQYSPTASLPPRSSSAHARSPTHSFPPVTRSNRNSGSFPVHSSLPPASLRQPTAAGGGEESVAVGDVGELQSQKQVLEAQVSVLSNKRERLASELEELLSQVHTMYNTLEPNKAGPAYHRHGNYNPSAIPVHMRWDSAPMESLPNGTPSHPHTLTPSLEANPSSNPTVHGSFYQLNDSAAANLPDPMVEFTPEQNMADPSRLSVAW